MSLRGEKALSEEQIASLFISDRLEHTVQIRKKIAEGFVVLCCRYDLSTYAYQAVESEVLYRQHRYAAGVEQLRFLRENASMDQGGYSLIPDLTFYLELDPKKAYARILKRNQAQNKQGQSKLTDFYEEEQKLTVTARRYEKSCLFLGHRDGREIVRVDASSKEDVVLESVCGRLDLCFQERLGKKLQGFFDVFMMWVAA